MEIKHRSQLNELLMHHHGALGNVAEIGVAEGLYSKDILGWGVQMLYLVDIWNHKPDVRGDGNSGQEWHDNNYNAVVERLKEYKDKTVFLKGDSVEMAKEVPDGSLSLVYIDADHSYEGVKRDIAAWYPKLSVGGIMAFHDYESPAYGVKQAVNEFAANNDLEVHSIPENHPDDAGAWFQKNKPQFKI